MGIAKARRIARRAHQGQLTRTSELFTDYLERVARIVEERDGGWAAVQAAWLHAVPGTGVDLTRQGIPWRVLRAVEALQPDPGWSKPTPAKVHLVPDAALVNEALAAGEVVDPPESSWQPVVLMDAGMLPQLLADYRERPGHETKWAIDDLFARPINLNTPAVAELAEQWWDSEDDWENRIAVLAARRAGLLDRERLLRKVLDGPEGSSVAAIESLSGEASAEEIEVLRTVVLRPEERWARLAARARLTAIGGPDAEAALQEWAFSPWDVPWRNDRAWLHRNAADVVPRLIEALPDPTWWYEAPFALGELRVVEAVGPLSEAAQNAEFPHHHIEALGKIGSADAVPALVRLLGHSSADVRAYVLWALDRIGGAEVVDAVIMACDDPDVMVRDRAARVLVRHGDERAVTPLIRLCDTRHAGGAAHALGRIGDPRAVPTLWHLFFRHDRKAVRYAAGRALARIDNPGHWCPSDDPRILRAYVWLHGHKPDWNRQSLEHWTKHTDALVRARAAEAYGRLRDPAGVEHVRPLLADLDPRVRKAAEVAMTQITRS
ncbi:HEAT repeat domain-containing protein [Lentzea alba]|uniref:HEAT repeat domain-containing protein n=1 Tax=Lentzea alba TaxID=2714351 RepID=UPI0039BF0D18